MRNLILFFCLIQYSLCTVNAQEELNINNRSIDALNNLSISNTSNGLGAASIITNPPAYIDGTVYLFDDWNHNVYIHVSSQKKPIRLNSNINFNADLNVFESKIDDKKTFTFNFHNINKIVVDNRIFESVYFPIEKTDRVFETIVSSDKFMLYKDYDIDLRKGNPNPMLARVNDKYVLKTEYYLKKGDEFVKFKMKKSSILKLSGDSSKSLVEYAKKKKLNLKSDEDLESLLLYYASL